MNVEFRHGHAGVGTQLSDSCVCLCVCRGLCAWNCRQKTILCDYVSLYFIWKIQIFRHKI